MNHPSVTHAYAAFRYCGHPIALVADLLDEEAEITAEAVASYIAEGYTIERVPLERAREIGVAYCSCVPTMAEGSAPRANPLHRKVSATARTIARDSGAGRGLLSAPCRARLGTFTSCGHRTRARSTRTSTRRTRSHTRARWWAWR